jgi:catalase
VLYDAVVIFVSEEAVSLLANQPAARDFVTDAFAHSKFIAYAGSAKPFLAKVLGSDHLDEGFIEIVGAKDISRFIQECRNMRFWGRQTASIQKESQAVGIRRVDARNDKAVRHR